MQFSTQYKLSDAKHWLNCAGWPKLVGKRKEQFDPRLGPPHPNQVKGLALHEVISQHIKARKFECDPAYIGTTWRSKEASHVFSPVDIEQVNTLLVHVEGRLAALGDAWVFQELKTDNRSALPVRRDNWYSYLDLVLAHPQQIEIIELKFGSTPVPLIHPDPHRFPLDEQTFLELAAIVERKDTLRLMGIDPGKVLRYRLTIFQPNAMDVPNFQDHWLTPKEYQTYLERAREAFAMAAGGAPAVKAGSWCGYCPAQAACRAFNALALSTYGAHGNAPESLQEALTREPDLMSHDEILAMLRFAPLASAHAKAVDKYALLQAQQGHRFRGYKLVRSNPRMKYTSDEAIYEWIERAQLPPDQATPRVPLAPSKLRSLAKNYKVADHMMKQFEQLVERPQGKVELKPNSSPAQPVTAAPAGMFPTLPPVQPNRQEN